jgi:hypothetical protein
MYITITVYVDDTSFEATGSMKAVGNLVARAVRYFTSKLVEIGMEFSPTKNVVLASSPRLAQDILDQLDGLHLKIVGNAKSLGGALSSGRHRNAAVATARLEGLRIGSVPYLEAGGWG